MKDKTAVILIVIGIIGIIGMLIFIFKTEKPVPVYTFDECVAQGNAVDEFEGRQRCMTKQGKVFFNIDESEFCGTSSEGICESDADCVTDGCSGQICRSVNDESAITTCEWQECYDDEKFNVRCGCVKNKCIWS